MGDNSMFITLFCREVPEFTASILIPGGSLTTTLNICIPKTEQREVEKAFSDIFLDFPSARENIIFDVNNTTWTAEFTAKLAQNGAELSPHIV